MQALHAQPSRLRPVTVALLGATLALMACDRKPSQPPTPTSSAESSTSPTTTGHTPPGVTAVPDAHAASSAGPSDGSAAIGGVAGPGTAGGGDTPPTGGDGAASGASK